MLIKMNIAIGVLVAEMVLRWSHLIENYFYMEELEFRNRRISVMQQQTNNFINGMQ